MQSHMARGNSTPTKEKGDCSTDIITQSIRCKLAPDPWVQSERNQRWTAAEVRKQVVDLMREQHQ